MFTYLRAHRPRSSASSHCAPSRLRVREAIQKPASRANSGRRGASLRAWNLWEVALKQMAGLPVPVV